MRLVPALLSVLLLVPWGTAQLASGGPVPGSLLLNVPWAPVATHAPIEVTDLQPGITFGSGIQQGSGTQASPYVISGWSIDVRTPGVSLREGTTQLLRDAIYIHDTQAYLVVENNQLVGSDADAILIVNAPHVSILDNTITLASGSSNVDANCESVSSGFGPNIGTNSCPSPNTAAAIDAQNSPNLLVAGNGIDVASAAVPVEGVLLSPAGSASSIIANTMTNHASGRAFVGVDVIGGAAVTINGNTITNDAPVSNFTGILVLDGLGDSVDQNHITDMSAQYVSQGILLEGVTFSDVSSNVVSTTRPLGSYGSIGLDAIGGTQVTFSSNSITRFYDGILLTSEVSDSLASNQINGCEFGFGWFGSRDNDFSDAVARSNSVNGNPILVFRGADNTIIDGTTLGPVGYLGVVDSTNVTVQNVAISGNVQGLLLADVDQGKAQNLTLTRNWVGLDLSDSVDTHVNDLRGNVWMHSSAYSTVSNASLVPSGNAIIPQYLDGVSALDLGSFGAFLFGSEGITFDHVTVTGAGAGIIGAIDAGGNGGSMTVSNSVILSNHYGIWIASTAGDVVSKNSIYQNSNANMEIEGPLRPAPATDARHNWWGSTSGPTGIVLVQGGTVVDSPYLPSPSPGAGSSF
ncbi:MAG: right-handed parallel beta-helix repeat-containing protein [Thermoplasmatota archaeon]